MAKSKSAPIKETAQEAGKRADLETKAKKVKDAVSQQVLKAIGTPRDLYKVDIRLLQPGRARVNVWRNQPEEKGRTCTGRVMTDSYYLWLSKEAKIKKSNPPLETKY